MSEVDGDGFDHLIIQRADPSSDTRLHVYIEGDGIPWIGNLPSADPTPWNTLALRLASQDPNDFIYVGRPCYFSSATQPQCTPKYWTSHRYSQEVIQSMAAAIEQARQPRHTEVVLIGHSGGGAIAALLDSRVQGVVGVVTVAANLDIDAWTAFHHYDPLTGSLNPVQQSRNRSVPHLQYVGGKDRTVPSTATASYSQFQPNVELIEFEKFDHVCCWEKEWPAILDVISTRLGHVTSQHEFQGH